MRNHQGRKMSRAFTEVPSANGEQPDPGRWNIDPVHSFITFRVVHFTINSPEAWLRALAV
jgi:hypothetical protein